MSGLNATEKQLLRVACFEASWLGGSAIAEATRMKNEDLYSQIQSNYQSVVTALDLDEIATRCVLTPVRDTHLVVFKNLLLQHMKQGNTFVRTYSFNYYFFNLYSQFSQAKQFGISIRIQSLCFLIMKILTSIIKVVIT